MNNYPVQFVTVRKAAELTGYSEAAIRKKISRGTWPENIVWHWALDNVQLIDLEGYQKWAKTNTRASSRGKTASLSTSDIRGKDTNPQ